MNARGQTEGLPPLHWQLSLHLEIEIEGWPTNGSPSQREHAARAWAGFLGVHELGGEAYFEGLADGITIAISPDPLDDDAVSPA